ncbi:signal recognition particle-docking protein FtsY [Buchnera aphidicola]|uniref:signal recognition particle-docking protein FtsY n=1 Tax=Buchnera aphidicola TaxID=9 RepID=UPI0022B2A93A|nr:signal recognition particle-docking protein FtsY [Buchnera aphidicola]
MNSIFSKQTIDSHIFKELRNLLLLSDFGVVATEKILYKFKKKINQKNILDTKIAISYFKTLLLDMLKISEKFEYCNFKTMPFVILIIGVNGAGKTTTAAKLAYFYKKLGHSVLLAAGDTFRSAAIDQLIELGSMYNIPVFSKPIGSDPASVAFDAVKQAREQKKKILIIDTAGRLHNKDHLIQELQKINRVIRKFSSTAPQEIFLVLDAGIGQNSIQQARIFSSHIKITGSIVTKLDGTAKGGIIFSIVKELMIPIRYIGIGEKITDFKLFNRKAFIDSFFDAIL